MDSDRHRKKAGRGVVKRMMCPVPGTDGNVCGRKFGRRDNLGQHLRKAHEGVDLTDFGPIKYAWMYEDDVGMLDE